MELFQFLEPTTRVVVPLKARPPRKSSFRDPQRAVQAVPGGLFADDADAIEDPVMRGIYKAARRKSLA